MIVLGHINSLFSSTDEEARRRAYVFYTLHPMCRNEFLMHWQQSVDAWSQSHSILNGSFPPEAKLIAAQTMRIKIMYDYYQLSSQETTALCESLVQHLADTALARNIASTLELALCDLAIQGAETWTCPAETFINCCNSRRLTLDTVLNLLESLPEEACNQRIIKTPIVDDKVHANLKVEYIRVVEFLFKIRKGNDFSMKETGRLLRCWHKWHRFDNYSDTSDACLLFLGDCIDIIHRIGADEFNDSASEAYEIAIDCLIDILEEVGYLNYKQSGIGHSSDDEKDDPNFFYSPRRHSDLQRVASKSFEICTSEAFLKGLARGFGEAPGYFNNLTRLYVHLTDALQYTLTAHVPAQALLISTLIHFIEAPYCAIYSSVSGLEKVFNCFDRSYNRTQARTVALEYMQRQGKESSLPDIDDETCGYASSAIYMLHDILVKSQTRENASLLTMAAKEAIDLCLFISTSPIVAGQVYKSNDSAVRDFEAYLDDVYRLIPPSASILGGAHLLFLGKGCTLDFPTYTTNIYALESGLTFSGAILATIDVRSVAKPAYELVAGTMDVIQEFFKTSPGVEHLAVKAWESALEFLSCARRILFLDESSQELPHRVYGILLSLLQRLACTGTNPSVGNSVNAAVREALLNKLVQVASNVTLYTRLNKVTNWENVLKTQLKIYELVEEIENQQQSSGYNLDVLMIEAVTVCICSLQNQREPVVQVIESMLSKWVQEIKVGIEKKDLSIGKLRQMLDRICTCVRNVSIKNALQIIPLEIIPLLLSLLSLFYENTELVELVCKCLKHCARCVEALALKQITTIVATAEQTSQRKLTCTYLYMVEWLHALIPRGMENGPEAKAIGNLYMMLTRHTLNVLQQQQQNRHQHQHAFDSKEALEDIVDDFFGLQTRILKYTNFLLDNLDLLQHIVLLGNAHLNISQPHCIYGFWMALLRACKSHGNYLQLATRALPNTIQIVFGSIASGCHSSIKRCIEDLVHEIYAAFGADETRKIIQIGATALPRSIVFNQAQLQQLVDAIVGDTKHDRASTIHEIHKLACQIAMRSRNQMP